MKKFYIIIILLLPVLNLIGQTSECTLKISYSINKTNPPSYTFKSNNTASNVKFYWYFGDNGTSDNPTPTYSYKVTGTYTVTLKVVDAAGKICRGTLTDKFEGTGMSTTGVTSTPTTCRFEISAVPKTSSPNIIQFNTVSSVTLKTWKWTFGDGQTSNLKEPAITYKNAGTYEVTCTVTTAEGCTSSSTAKVTIAPVLLSGKGKVKDSGNPSCGLLIYMENGATILPIEMATPFTLKNGQYVEVAYEMSTKTSPCSVAKPVKILKIAEIPATTTCHAYFTTVRASETDPVLSKKVTFKNQSTGEVKEVKWSFGDGTTSTVVTTSLLHEYKEYGEYRACLTIVTAAGCSSDYCATVNVKNPSTTGTGATVTPTNCRFEITAKPKTEGSAIIQFNTVSVATLKTWKWTFGDGQTSTLKEPLITFQNFGTYEVTCTVTTAEGCTSSSTTKVIIAPVTLSGKGKVKNSGIAGCGLLIYMENGATLLPVEMVPNFTLRDGQYVEVGYEMSTKTSTCTAGKPAKIIKIAEITETASCKAYFTTTKASETDPVLSKKVTFKNQSTGDIKELKWTFGDGSTSTQVTSAIVHEYKEFGEYRACLTIATAAGCRSEYCASVLVKNPAATATNTSSSTKSSTCSFEISAKPKTDAANVIQFNTVSSYTLKTWNWSFGDGQTATIKEPLITYKNPGTYEVKCIVTTAEGCTTSRTTRVTITSVSSLPVCKGAIVLTLTDPSAGLCDGKAMARLVDEKNNDIPNVKYQWSTGKTGNTADGLCADKTYILQAFVEGVCQKGTSFAFQSKPVWRVTTSGNGSYGFTVIDPVNNVTYNWDLGDGNTATGPSVNHAYSKDGIYSVKLSVITGGTSADFSQEVNINKSLTSVGIIRENQFTIYPNPATDMVRIDFGTEMTGKLFIEAINFRGQKVLSQQMLGAGHSLIDLDIHQLPSGLYILKVTNENLVVQSQKFLKND